MTVPERLIAHRVHNNNVVLAVDARGDRVIATGPGVGFGVRRGTALDPQRVEVVYVPRSTATLDAELHTLAQFEPRVLETAQRIIRRASSSLSIPHPQALLIPLTDHVSSAVDRVRRGIVVDVPLAWEVGTLYPAEFAVGRAGVETVQDNLDVRLPDDEAAALAMHFVSTQFATPRVDRTLQMTQTLDEIFDLLDDWRGAPLDRRGHAATRFVTHLRYVFVRMEAREPVAETPTLVHEALASALPEVMRIAHRIAQVLERRWHQPLNADEVAYIGLHVHRLLTTSDRPDITE